MASFLRTYIIHSTVDAVTCHNTFPTNFLRKMFSKATNHHQNCLVKFLHQFYVNSVPEYRV